MNIFKTNFTFRFIENKNNHDDFRQMTLGAGHFAR